jgi:GNAT superfamily N-acetyltransferase
MSDRLLALLQDAARGAPPPADGAVEVWPAPPGPVDAVLAFTAHHVVEVDPARRNRGLGRLLVAAARHPTPPGEPLFAQVAPGNAASLRAVGAAGFRPIGGRGLFHRGRRHPG